VSPSQEPSLATPPPFKLLQAVVEDRVEDQALAADPIEVVEAIEDKAEEAVPTTMHPRVILKEVLLT
jgi:hypothetical protein